MFSSETCEISKNTSGGCFYTWNFKWNYFGILERFFKELKIQPRAEQPLQGKDYKPKKSKQEKISESELKRAKPWQASIKSRLKDQSKMKTFHMQKNFKSSCTGNDTIGISIFITFRKGDRINMQPISMASRPPTTIR